jgi:hypothetical protein
MFWRPCGEVSGMEMGYGSGVKIYPTTWVAVANNYSVPSCKTSRKILKTHQKCRSDLSNPGN